MSESGITSFEVDGVHSIERGDICEMCEDSASVGYCTGCECYICQLCFDHHVKIKKYCHHVLRVAPESKDDESKIYFETCTNHKQQEVRLYCTDHNCFGCGECMLFNHKDCKYKYITEASKEFRDSGELTRFLEDIQDLENIHENCVKSIASQSQLSDNIEKTTKNDVKQFVKDVAAYITDEEKRVIKNADLRKSANDDRIEKLSDDLERNGSDITSISTNIRSENEIHKLFILVVEAKPKLSQIRDELDSIDCEEVIDRYKFYPNRLLQRQLLEKRSLGKVSDHTQSEEDDEGDSEGKYKAEYMDTQRFKQQISIQEKNTKQEQNQWLEQDFSPQEQQHKQPVSTQTLGNQRLKQQLAIREHDTNLLKQQLSTQEHQFKQQLSSQEQQFKHQLSAQTQENQRLNQQLYIQEQASKQQMSPKEQYHPYRLACGHTCDIEQMDTNRTITCPTCGIIFGVIVTYQPNGTLRTDEHIDNIDYIELKFIFDKKTQSTLDWNPAKHYEGNEVTGFVQNNVLGKLILNMLKLAFDRAVLFTINTTGQIITNGIDIFTETPPSNGERELHSWWHGYSERVKKQLRAKGITEADVPK